MRLSHGEYRVFVGLLWLAAFCSGPLCWIVGIESNSSSGLFQAATVVLGKRLATVVFCAGWIVFCAVFLWRVQVKKTESDPQLSPLDRQ